MSNLIARRGIAFASLAVIAASLMASASPLAAQTVRSVPGYVGTDLPRNDDGSTGLVNLGFNINFFGFQTSQTYVNNNGNITFDQPLSTFTPFGLTATQRRIIAPFFGDVDTRNPASGITNYGQATINGRPAFLVNWPTVGYFSNRVDKTNDFQLILYSRPDRNAGDFDFEFNYNRIQWETGNASGGTDGLGGTPARAGFSNGSGQPGTSFEINGSGIAGALLDANQVTGLIRQSNIGTPGRFLFTVVNGVVMLVPLQPNQPDPVGIPVVPLATFLEDSLRTISASASVMQNLGWGTLETTREIAREYDCNRPGPSGSIGTIGRLCAFAVVSGAYGDNDEARDSDPNARELAGTAGLTWQPNGAWRFGIGVTYGSGRIGDLKYGGKSEIDSWGGLAYAHYRAGAHGPRALLAGYYGVGDVDTHRGAIIGRQFDRADGDTDASAWGGLLRGEWSFATGIAGAAAIPFAEIGWMRTKVDGFTEHSGAFPTAFNDLTDTSARSRLGLELRYETGPFSAWGSLAWVHEFNPDGADVSGKMVGFAPFVFDGAKERLNWGEVNVGGSYQLTSAVKLIGSSTTSVAPDIAPDWRFRLGLNVVLN